MNIDIGVDQGPGNLPTTGYEANPLTWLDADQEFDSVMPEYYRQIDGLGMGMDAIEDLMKAQDILVGTESIDPAALKMVKTIMSYHQERLKMPLMAVGTESIFETREAAVEGLGNFLKSIVTAIINTIKAIFSAIGRLFGSARKKKSMDRVEFVLNQKGKDMLASFKIPDAPVKHSIFNYFSHLGSEITIKDIAKEVDQFFAAVKSSIKYLDSLNGYSKRVTKGVDTLVKEDPITEEGLKKFAGDAYSGGGNTYVSVVGAVKNNFERLHSHKDYEESLDEMARRMGVDSAAGFDVYHLKGYMAQKSFGCAIIDTDPMTNFEFFLQELNFHVLQTNFKAKVAVSCDMADARSSFPSLMEALKDVEEHNANFDKAIKNLIEDYGILDKLDKLVNKKTTVKQEDFRHAMYFIRSLTDWLSDLGGLVSITDRSVHYYCEVFMFIQVLLAKHTASDFVTPQPA